MIRLTAAELAELLELTRRAETTPMISMGFGQSDWATSAWEDVRCYWEKLGRIHGFHPENVSGIDRKSGEVHLR